MDAKTILFLWLGCNIALILLSQYYFWQFLQVRGVHMTFFYIGTPGYLDRKYVRWCQANGRRYLPMIIARAILFCSVILTAFLLQIVLAKPS